MTTAKVCRGCQELKPLSAYSKHSTSRDGLRTRCKGCDAAEHLANRDVRNAKRKARYLANPKPQRLTAKERYHSDPEYRQRKLDLAAQQNERRRAAKYGLTTDDLDAMLEAQGAQCAICPQVLTVFNVDHCHRTGKVRGLLCRDCNLMLGNAKDDPARLTKAAEYVLEFVS